VDDAIYPFAQRAGPLWLVGVNSCTGNRWAWDAGGSVGRAQLQRLQQLLSSIARGPRILITHYPVCMANGKRERITHGLRDVDEVVAVATKGGIGLWLHGHRHHPYFITPGTAAPFPVICAGSATQTGCWSYGQYTLDGGRFHVRRRIFDLNSNQFRDDETFEVELDHAG
jgi:hypothetical protein